MTFDQWLKRPVYKAQCVTYARARQLCKMPALESGQGEARGPGHLLDTFHALPGYRDPFAQALRDMVALSVRMDRAAARLSRNG